MTILELLQEKGFVEGQDFSLSGEELVAIQKSRQVEQHVMIFPAVVDAEGVEISPAQYEMQMISELYFEQLPSMQEMKRELVSKEDVAHLISLYLADKQTSEDDSFNSELFMNGGNGWRFATVPAPSMDELFALITPSKTKMEQDSTNAAALEYLAKTDWYVSRFTENGTPIPEAVVSARAAARSSIIK